MTCLTTFALFPNLPKELRLQIWKQAVSPRILKLKPIVTPFDPRHAPPFLYFVGGLGPPLRHFTLDHLDRPEEPYFTVHLMPFEFQSPPLLRVCKESRDIALESGYRVWKMDDQKGRIRNVMWNLERDFVCFEEHWRVRSPMEVLVKQYPDQARQARRVCARSSVWALNLNARRETEIICPLLRMAAREFAVLIDEQFERERAEWCREQLGFRRGMSEWHVPSDVRQCLVSCFHHMSGGDDEELSKELADWKVPEVRVVWNEEGLLGDEELELTLRTWPCGSF